MLGLLGPSLCGAPWLESLTLWHPTEPCFLLDSLTFILVTALSVRLSVSDNNRLQLPLSNLFLFHLDFFFLSSSSSSLVLPHGWFVIIHSPPPVKRIRLAINARLDKAGTSCVREEGSTDPHSFVIG